MRKASTTLQWINSRFFLCCFSLYFVAYKPPPGFVQQTENLPDGANQSTNSNQYDTFVLGPNSIPNVPDAAGKSSYQTPLLQNMDLCTKPVKHDGTQFQLMDSANRMLNPINDSQTSRSPNPKAESTDSQAPYRSRSPSLTLESSKSSTSFYNPQLPKLSPPSDKRTNRSHSSASSISINSQLSTPSNLLEAALASTQKPKRHTYPMWKQPTIEEIRNCCTTKPRSAHTVTNDVGHTCFYR